MNFKEDIDRHIIREVGQAADWLGQPTYIIGGYVRDLFLKRRSPDLDFVTVGSGEELARTARHHSARASLLGRIDSAATATA